MAGNDQNHPPEVAVIMVPLPAQGHLNQLLHLSRILLSTSSYNNNNIQVHYLSFANHSRQAKLRVHGWDSLAATGENIHFHEFQPPSFQSPLPNSNSPIKFPSHLQPSFDASSHLRLPFNDLLRALSPSFRRVAVIHDSMMSSIVQDFVSVVSNAECYAFHSVSAFSVFWFLWETMGRPFEIEPEMLDGLPSIEGCFSAEFAEFIGSQLDQTNLCSGNLLNACRSVEGRFIDLLSREEISGGKKNWAIGPFNPVSIIPRNKRHKTLEWLDKHPKNSVIFVSFGTTTSLSNEQIKELAIGLEQSEQRFIWVLREADTGDVLAGESRTVDLPAGFVDRVSERGVVVRDWAPQLEILGHGSTGGFMSHCGWNSCVESISMGVPVAAWPMHSDQPRNATLVSKFLKIGFLVKDWDRRDEVVAALNVEKAVRMLMTSKEGDEMRRRAAELGGEVRRSVADGGVSRLELDCFVAHLVR